MSVQSFVRQLSDDARRMALCQEIIAETQNAMRRGAVGEVLVNARNNEDAEHVSAWAESVGFSVQVINSENAAKLCLTY